MTEYYRKPAIPSGTLRALFFLVCWILLIGIIEYFGLNWIIDLFPTIDHQSVPFQSASRGFSLVLSLLLILLFRKWVDRRPFLKDWFTFTNRKTDLIAGFAAGIFLMAIGAFILGQTDHVSLYPGTITGTEFWQYLIFFLIVSLLEEIVFRGYVLTNLLDDMHPFLALVLSSGVFMVIHLFNPNIQPLPIINLFLAGILLGASFIYTKNLWFPIGLHWSWNLFQGPVFGFEVSGFPTKSLFQQDVLKDNIWTGGPFGFEGSILATILIVLAIITTLYTFKRFSNDESN